MSVASRASDKFGGQVPQKFSCPGKKVQSGSVQPCKHCEYFLKEVQNTLIQNLLYLANGNIYSQLCLFFFNIIFYLMMPLNDVIIVSALISCAGFVRMF